MIKKIIILCLSVVLAISLPTKIFAADVSTFNHLETPEENHVIVETSDNIKEIIINDDDAKTVVSIINKQTQKVDYIVKDKKHGTIYSSITGETIKPNNEVNSPFVTFKVKTSYEVKRVSFAELKKALGDQADIAGIAAFLFSIIPVTEPLSSVISVVSAAVGGVSKFVIPDDNNKGLEISYKVDKYYRGPIGKKHLYKKVYKILDVNRYETMKG